MVDLTQSYLGYLPSCLDWATPLMMSTHVSTRFISLHFQPIFTGLLYLPFYIFQEKPGSDKTEWGVVLRGVV